MFRAKLSSQLMSIAGCFLLAFACACSNLQSTSRSGDAATSSSQEQDANSDISEGRTSQVIAGTNILSPETLARASVESATIVPILKNGSKALRIAASIRIEIKDTKNVAHELFAPRDKEFVATGKYLSFPIPKDVTGAVVLAVTNIKTGLSSSVPVNIDTGGSSNLGAGGGGNAGFLLWLHSVTPGDFSSAISSGNFLVAIKELCISDSASMPTLFPASPNVFPVMGSTNTATIEGSQLYLTNKDSAGLLMYESAGLPTVTDFTYFATGTAAPRPRLANGDVVPDTILETVVGRDGGDCNGWSNFTSASVNLSSTFRTTPNIFKAQASTNCANLTQGTSSFYIACAAHFSPR